MMDFDTRDRVLKHYADMDPGLTLQKKAEEINKIFKIGWKNPQSSLTYLLRNNGMLPATRTSKKFGGNYVVHGVQLSPKAYGKVKAFANNIGCEMPGAVSAMITFLAEKVEGNDMEFLSVTTKVPVTTYVEKEMTLADFATETLTND